MKIPLPITNLVDRFNVTYKPWMEKHDIKAVQIDVTREDVKVRRTREDIGDNPTREDIKDKHHYRADLLAIPIQEKENRSEIVVICSSNQYIMPKDLREKLGKAPAYFPSAGISLDMLMGLLMDELFEPMLEAINCHEDRLYLQEYPD
jgi:hypothetical protein